MKGDEPHRVEFPLGQVLRHAKEDSGSSSVRYSAVQMLINGTGLSFQIGDERLDTINRDGENKRAQHLYGIATTTKNGDLRREALLFLGALERGGNVEAARALEKIRKNEERAGSGR